MIDKYLTAKQVKDLTGWSRGSLINWESLGKLHPVKTVKGHRRYREKEILTLFEQSNEPQSKDILLQIIKLLGTAFPNKSFVVAELETKEEVE